MTELPDKQILQDQLHKELKLAKEHFGRQKKKEDLE